MSNYFSKPFSVLLMLSLGSCETVEQEIHNPVTWYAVNGWSDTVNFELFDVICERYLRDVRLRPGRQVTMTTCGDEQGNASVRYRRDRIAATGAPWTREPRISPQQTIYMQ